MTSSSKPTINDLPDNQLETFQNTFVDAAAVATRMFFAAEYGRFGVAQLASDFVRQQLAFTILGTEKKFYTLQLSAHSRPIARFDSYPQFEDILGELFEIWKRAVTQSGDDLPKYVNDLTFEEFLLQACSKKVRFTCPDDPDGLALCLDYHSYDTQFDGLSQILATIEYDATV